MKDILIIRREIISPTQLSGSSEPREGGGKGGGRGGKEREAKGRREEKGREGRGKRRGGTSRTHSSIDGTSFLVPGKCKATIKVLWKKRKGEAGRRKR